MKKMMIAAALMLAACNEATAPEVKPDITPRYGKPSATPTNITLQLLGTLSSSSQGAGSPIGMALNNGASRAMTRVAGYTPYGSTLEHPFTWTLSSGTQPLQLIDPGYGWPTGVSDNGIIVGEMARFGGIGNRAFIVTADGPMSYLTIPTDATDSRASGISADGTCISGSFSSVAGSFAVVWRSGILDTIAAGTTSGISNDCTVVSGYSARRAALWRWNGSDWILTPLPSAGKGSVTSSGDTIYSETTDISPNGLYVAGVRRNGATSYAEVWRFNGSAWVATDMPGSTLYAFGVDNSGRAVGNNSKSEPVLWTRSSSGSYTAQVLPSSTRNTSGWAAAINELGQVSGRTRTNDGWRAAIWTVN